MSTPSSTGPTGGSTEHGPGAEWFLPLGRADGGACGTQSGTSGCCRVHVDDQTPGWAHTGLHVVDLEPGATWQVGPRDWEHVVVPLSGSVLVEVVDADGHEHRAELEGRASVFDGPSDVAYAPAGSSLAVTATQGPVSVAVCAARTERDDDPGSSGPSAPFRHVARADIPVELRGAGQASREVRNFGVPAVLDAESIIACEVVTPAGNWSSYPPHKHDEEREGLETELEEIYYFATQVSREAGEAAAGAPDGAVDPVGYQRVYGTQARPIEVLAEVRTGDVVLVPHGWHGPSMAAPGYDLYYLNVMAGPGPQRAWLICDDPRHGWVRETWAGLEVDPRLPMRPSEPASSPDDPTNGRSPR